MKVQTFICSQCDYTCSESYQLKKHAMMHARSSAQISLTRQIKVQNSNALNPYSCTTCGYSCSKLGVMQRHARKHTHLSKPFICEFCDFVCSHLMLLETHMKMHLWQKHQQVILFWHIHAKRDLLAVCPDRWPLLAFMLAFHLSQLKVS